MEIIPAILAKDERELKEKLERLPVGATWVHIDFTSPNPLQRGNKTILPLRGVPKGGGMFLEAHLMLPDPRSLIDELVRDGFSRVIVQVASSATPPMRRGGTLSPEAFAELLHEWRAVVEIVPSLELGTSLSSIDSFAHELKSVQLMGIAEIGAQGKPFNPRVISRVKTLHARYPHLTISVDGGVKKENAKGLVAAGAGRLVVGSALREFYTTDTPPFPSP